MIAILSRLSRRKPPPIPYPPQRHPFSTNTTSSNLRSRYSFAPSLQPQTKTTIPTFQPDPETRKPLKPRYRPSSSLEKPDPPTRSDLPFDFRFSYTESSTKVRPIGLREPKYYPFGPGRVDRVWTGVCAPAVDPKVGSVGVEGELEERRRLMRDGVQGEPLSGAERRPLVERCQRHKTKRQINLGRDGLTQHVE